MAIQIQLRRGISTLWTSTNPTLAEGELGLETDTGKFKVGNGSTAWITLLYNQGSISSGNPVALGSVSAGTSNYTSREDHVHPTTGIATLASPTFTGAVTLSTDTLLNLNYVTADPALSSAGILSVYSKSVAGKIVPKWIADTGSNTQYQAFIGQNKVGIWMPPGNGTVVPGVTGFTAPTAIGTATARAVASTNLFTRILRLGYNSAATSGQAGGHFQPIGQYTVGSGTSGIGGFFYVCRFGAADAVTQAISFVGLSNLIVTPVVTTSPAAFTNCIGVGAATGDTNLSIYYGGSTAQTPIALGSSFPKSSSSTNMYELILYSPSTSSTTVGYKVTNLLTNVVAEGTLTAATTGTQLPATTTFLAHRAYRSNNATASAVLIDIASVYVETEN